MTEDQRYIVVDLSWTEETSHPWARGEIISELIRDGWDLCDNEDGERPSFCRTDGPDFDGKLAQAQLTVGRRVVTETGR